jgi:hypothetical protein
MLSRPFLELLPKLHRSPAEVVSPPMSAMKRMFRGVGFGVVAGGVAVHVGETAGAECAAGDLQRWCSNTSTGHPFPAIAGPSAR